MRILKNLKINFTKNDHAFLITISFPKKGTSKFNISD